jgi:hypothetical protein
MAEEKVAAMNQCSILYLKNGAAVDSRQTHAPALRALGFHVDEFDDLPANEVLAAYHAVIVRPAPGCNLPMLAARVRAKPRFGRRVLVALVPDAMAARAKREAVLSGFDYTLPDTCGARDLAATVLRLLRPYPEYRCLLRWPGGRRKAA